jgi:hypothetical protein
MAPHRGHHKAVAAGNGGVHSSGLRGVLVCWQVCDAGRPVSDVEPTCTLVWVRAVAVISEVHCPHANTMPMLWRLCIAGHKWGDAGPKRPAGSRHAAEFTRGEAATTDDHRSSGVNRLWSCNRRVLLICISAACSSATVRSPAAWQQHCVGCCTQRMVFTLLGMRTMRLILQRDVHGPIGHGPCQQGAAGSAAG